MSEIISKELPQVLIEDIVYATNNDNAKTMEIAHQRFIDAQKQAILRFCEAVEKEAGALAFERGHTQAVSWMDTRDAMEKIRDSIKDTKV